MNQRSFVDAVTALRFRNCFNPYTDCCDVYDRPDAPIIRARALSAMLETATRESIDALWIGRDLGYRGGRRTGMALTDDIHVSRHAERWGFVAGRVTNGVAMAERTAAVIWSLLDRIDARVFLWNVFPLHPHESGEPFTNRQHNANERGAGEDMLQAIIEMLRPARVIAIGNDASVAAKRVSGDVPVVCVRHPSYGGQRTFLRQIVDLYDLAPRSFAI